MACKASLLAVLLPAVLLFLATLARAQGNAFPQWAYEIAGLLGSNQTASTSSAPNGIVIKGPPGSAADGMQVKSAPAFNPTTQTYTWTGPAGTVRSSASQFAHHHPAMTVALTTAAFFKLADMVEHRPPPPPVPEFFVQIANGEFITGVDQEGTCKHLYPAGFNKFEFVEAGAGAPRLFDAQLTDATLTGPAAVRRMLLQAKTNNLTLLRMNAFAVDSQYSVALQPGGVGSPVVYNEGLLKGLDYVLSEAQKRGLKVLLVLTDYFADGAGGPKQYLQFAGVDTTCDTPGFPSCDDVKSQFFVNPTAQQLYQQYAAALASRVNTINGRTYRQDPTIWGWDLINEPRCTDNSICVSGGTAAIDTWVAANAAYLKSLDSTHLVTVGLDGFYLDPPGVSTNPFTNTYNTDWVSTSGQPGIDFASFNVYPDQWLAANADFDAWIDAWIAQHSADAVTPLAKPAIIKELGAQPTPQRLPLYQEMLSKALSTITQGTVGGLKGGNYFQGWIPETSAVWWTLAQGGRFGILPSDTAYPLISQFADGAKALEQTLACPANPLLAPIFPPTPNCPRGYEGPNCDQDVDECVRGLDRCSPNAACINTVGSYTCKCHLTFIGNGRVCIPDSRAQAQLDANFFTNQMVNGFPGSQNVPYPTTAPGWVADPTGYFSEYGSRLNVTLFDCKVACETAGPTVCTSFFYNFLGSSCFLKSGECPLQQEQAPSTSDCTYTVYADGVANAVAPYTSTYPCGEGYTYYRVDAALPPGCTAS